MILNADGTPYVLATPYSAEQAMQFCYAQERDAMFFAHWDVPLKSLTRYAHDNWVWDDVFKDTDGDRVSAPEKVFWYDNGAGNGHNGFEYTVTSYKIVEGTPQESIGGYVSIRSDPNEVDFISEVPANNVDSIYLWEDKYKEKYGERSDFPAVPKGFNVSLDIPRDQTAPRTAKYASGLYGGLNQTLFDMLKQVYPAMEWCNNGHEYTMGIGNSKLSVESWRMLNSSGGMVGSPYTFVGLVSGGFSTTLYSEWKPYVYGVDNTTIMREVVRRLIVNNQITVDGKTAGDAYQDILDFVDTYNANSQQKAGNHVAWSASDGADGYYVYRRVLDGTDKRFYKVAEITDPAVLDWLEEDVSVTVPESVSPIETEVDFDTPDNYPALVTFFQQRMVLGNTKTSPTTMWGSRTGIYTDFAVQPGDVSGPYQFKMASRQSNPLESIIPLYTLVILTSGGDFVSTVGGAMNETNVNFNQKSYNGSSEVLPVIVGDSGIYIPISQQTVNAMAYSYEKDGFSHQNILFQAQHFSRGRKIVQIAYQRDPINLIWILFDDGKLASCTYIPQQDFLAWARHETDGFVKSINIVPTNQGIDELYLVTERTKGDGTKKQYMEVMEDLRPFGDIPSAKNSFFCDCGLSGNFPDGTKVVSGLGHLEGREVVVLADNAVIHGKTVTNGSITLGHPAVDVHVGLRYEYKLRTLNFDLAAMGTLRNTRSSVHEAIVELEETRELLWSACGGDENELVVHNADDFNDPMLYTGDREITMKGRNARGAYLEFRSENPVPATVCSLVLEVRHGDS